jgi:hypothetical protein
MNDMNTELRMIGSQDKSSSNLKPEKKRSSLSKTIRAKRNSRAKMLKKFTDFDAENTYERLNIENIFE